MSFFRFCSLSIVAVLSAGCATKATLVVQSQPEGAQISEVGTGTVFGVAPVSVVYAAAALEKYRDANGCYRVNGLQAKWVSGATSVLNPVHLCAGKTGSYSITLNRDSSAPGFDQDMQFALQVRAVQAQQQQAEAARSAAASQAYLNTMRALQAMQPTRPPPTVYCTSNVFGNTISTTCR